MVQMLGHVLELEAGAHQAGPGGVPQGVQAQIRRCHLAAEGSKTSASCFWCATTHSPLTVLQPPSLQRAN